MASHSFHGTIRSIWLRNSFFFVRTCANSSLNAEIVICLSISLLWQHRTMGAAGFGGSFAPIVQYEKWEIHPVFPHFPYFRSGQNLSPNLLSPLCGVALYHTWRYLALFSVRYCLRHNNTPHSVVSKFCYFECLLYGEHIKTTRYRLFSCYQPCKTDAVINNS